MTLPASDSDGWEIIKPLGSGGQGDVYLARSPQNTSRRRALLRQIREGLLNLDRNHPRPDDIMIPLLADLQEWANLDDPAGLGALKVFRIPDGPDADKALKRLAAEIEALQRFRGTPGLLEMLHANPEQRILVTAFHANGALSGRPEHYKGNALAALEAIRPVVAAVARLHADRFVHRDIKPENVFVDADEQLTLGDFGIVFFDDPGRTRVSGTYENVGSRDWMPAWAFGMSIDDISPAFDIFCLGKTIWAMIAGKTKLRLWYIHDEAFDLERLFPDSSPDMQIVNALLDKCVVEREKDCRLPTGTHLLAEVDSTIAHLRGRSQILQDEIPRRCQVCGTGTYRPALKQNKEWSGQRLLVVPPADLRGKVDATQLLNFRPEAGFLSDIYFCNRCGHAQIFWLPDGHRLPAWSSS